MKNLKKMIKGAVVGAMALTCAWGIGNITHAEELNTTPEYGTIEDLGDGKWIGADSLMPEETVDSTDVTETEVDKTENTEEINSEVENSEDTASTNEEVSDETEGIISDTTSSDETVVADEKVSNDVIVDEKSEAVENKATTLEMPMVNQRPVVVNEVVVEPTTDEIVSDTTSSDDTVVADEVVSDNGTVDEKSETVTDESNVDNNDVIVDTNDSNNFYEDFSDDYVLEETPEVKGDDLYEDTTPIKNTKLIIYEDFVDDFVPEDEIKGDNIFPEPEPTPEPTPEETPNETPEPEKVPETVVPTTPTKVVQETPTKVVKTNIEKTPEVLGDNLFDAPKTGDNNDLFFYTMGIILSLGTLIVMKRKNFLV